MFWSSRIPEAGVVGGGGEFAGDGGSVDGYEVPGGDRGDGESVADEGVAGDDGLRVVAGCTGQHKAAQIPGSEDAGSDPPRRMTLRVMSESTKGS
jgi:hypothetical protein